MREVNKKEFFDSFSGLTGISTACHPDHRTFVVRHNGVLVAKAIEENEKEKYYIHG